MILEEIKNIRSGRDDLRKFGITMAVVLGLLGLLFLWRGKCYYPYFFILSAVFFIFAVLMPGSLRPINKAWMTLSILMGWFMTRLILTVLFYLVITPIGLVVRLFGKDLLAVRFDRNSDSYWIPRETIKYERKNYENQF